MMRIVGIDEAGRGCVIGPLVLAGLLVEENQLGTLATLGVRDSKELSPGRREDLFPRITQVALSYQLRLIEPVRIDATNLNLLECQEITELIRILSPQRVFFDVPTHPSGIANFVKGVSIGLDPQVELIGENKADQKFPVVSAASILAKVTRDRIVSQLREEYGDFGSGYLSDPKTEDFLRSWFGEHGDFPPMVRRKWSSVQRFLTPQPGLPHF